jgi:rsbT antagonist protein RsbS
MTTSIIKVGTALIVTFSEDIGDVEAMNLQEELYARIEQSNASAILLEVSSLQTVDSFLGRLLNDISQGARLLGAETVVAGMQPAVAMTLVELGLRLQGVKSALDADSAMRLLRTHLNEA